MSRRASKLGASRVRQELQSKGIDAATFQEAMDGLRETEQQRARAVWLKKFGTPPADANERARQIRFLVSRGFQADAVRRVVQGADDE